MPLLAAGLVGALALGLRATVADVPLERDEGEYAYTAWAWLAGDVPYRDSFLQKPPGAVAVYAGILRTLGATPGAIHWGAQLWTLGTLACVLALGWRWFSAPAALAAGLLLVLLTVDPVFLGNAANTELLALLPLAAGMLAAERSVAGPAARWAFAAGLAGAAALSFKPVAAPVVAVAAARIAWGTRGRLAPLAAYAAGGLGAGAAGVAYFVAAGAWQPFFDATVRYNLAYGTSLPFSAYWASLRLQAGELLPSLAPLVLVAAAGLALRLRPGSAPGAAPGRGFAWSLAWLGAACLAASAGGYFRNHYFMFVAPPLALLAGAGLDEAARRLGRDPRTRLLAVAGAAVLVLHAVWSAPWYYLPGDPAAKCRRLYANNPFVESLAVADWVARHSTATDRLFVFGSEPQVLFYARRRSATRYIFVYPLLAPFPGVRERQQEALRQVRAARPAFIVATFLETSLLEHPDTAPDLRRGLRELVEADYRLVAATPFRPDGSVSFVTGDAARGLWARRPLWEETRPWASFVVWQRVGPAQSSRSDAPS